MRSEGAQDLEIRRNLRQRGLSEREIDDAMAQTSIKEAIGAPPAGADVNDVGEDGRYAPFPETPSPGAARQRGFSEAIQNSGAEYNSVGGPSQYSAQPLAYEGMEPSILGNEPETVENQGISQQQYLSQQDGGGYESYGNAGEEYQGYQGGMSSDVINEIAEQVVSDKLSLIRDKIEQAVDFKNSAETKLAHLDERLKRIERVIDNLQISVLQRMGEYVSDVKDIKKEMVETQKSFKSLSSEKRARHTSHEHLSGEHARHEHSEHAHAAHHGNHSGHTLEHERPRHEHETHHAHQSKKHKHQ